MRESINEIIQGLNQISRMAVLENAQKTERMVSILSKWMKYRFTEEKKMVIARKEILMANMILESVDLGGSIDMQCELVEETDLNSIFLPHYSISAYVNNIMKALLEETRQCKVTIRATGENEKVIISLRFEGEFKPSTCKQRASQLSKRDEYEDLERVKERWQEQFGENTIELIENDEEKQLLVTMTCF